MTRPLIAIPAHYKQRNTIHTREALRARSLRKQEGPVWDAYAGCDRAPYLWEQAV